MAVVGLGRVWLARVHLELECMLEKCSSGRFSFLYRSHARDESLWRNVSPFSLSFILPCTITVGCGSIARWLVSCPWSFTNGLNFYRSITDVTKSLFRRHQCRWILLFLSMIHCTSSGQRSSLSLSSQTKSLQTVRTRSPRCLFTP